MKEVLPSYEESNLDVEGFRDLQRRSREFATAKIAEDVGFTKAHELALVVGFQRGWCAKSPGETPAEPKQDGESIWLLAFADQEAQPPLAFSGAGADAAARRKFERASDMWTCRLFRCVAQSGYGPPTPTTPVDCHGLDTAGRVCFYEQDFYVLSNFSSFNLRWEDRTFPTSEHAYHWEKFTVCAQANGLFIRDEILRAPSAHEAFKLAERWKSHRLADWNDRKVGAMRRILRAKADQHEYVRRKLLATGDRELVENSWRDDYWGWGPNRDGKNMLGKLWMEVRAELRSAVTTGEPR